MINKENIIKTLEWCSTGRNCIKCKENTTNPFLSKEGCMAVQMRNAPTLIKELTIELDAMRGAANSYKMHYDKVTEENERLRADTVRKMQERLKEKMNDLSRMDCIFNTYFLVSKSFIDQIAKEMLGDINND